MNLNLYLLENWKRTLLISIYLFFVSSMIDLILLYLGNHDIHFGFPLGMFYEYETCCCEGPPTIIHQLDYLNILVDLIFWFVFVLILNFMKTRKNQG